MDRTVVPLKVQEYVLAQTGERHLNLQLDLFNIDVTDHAFKDKEVVIFSLKRRFPMVAEFRHRHMDVLMKGDDPEHPLSQYTLAHFDCGPLGTFYFLFQGIEPSFLFDERDNEMRPVFSKENVLKSLAPGATIATCKVDLLIAILPSPSHFFFCRLPA